MYERSSNSRGRDQDALAAFQAGERLAERLVGPHPLGTRLRALMLRTLVRTGATDRVELALAGLDEKERETWEMRATLAALRFAQGDPRAATLALGPVIDGSTPMTKRASLIEALRWRRPRAMCSATRLPPGALWNARRISPSPTPAADHSTGAPHES